jgi:kynureninase
MDWAAWRDEFPVFRKRVYLNTCSLGPLARRVRAAHDRFLDEWEDRGAAAWYDRWLDELDALRGKFARAIGAAKEEVAVAPSVSVALSGIASCLDPRDRPKVVLSELDFPTVSYQWAVKPGVQRVFVPSEDRVWVPPERYEEAIDDDTAAVATSHVFYLSGAVQDIGRIARAARAHGALSIIDAYHATGQLPTDVHQAGVDVLVTGGLKWLLGGTGIALLYVRRDRIPDLRPTIAGWFGNARQFEFDLRAFAYHDDARRFELGTPAMAAVYAASAGLELVLGIGIERLRARQTELVNDLAERAVDAGLEVRIPSDPDRRAGIVMVRLDDPARAVQVLGKQGVVVDYRHDRLRASPFFYNTPEDHVALVETIAPMAP